MAKGVVVGGLNGGMPNVKSLQRGTGSMTYANTVNTVAINPVDLSKAIVLISYTSSSSYAGYYGQHHIRAELTNTNTITLTKGNTNSDPSFSWVVIEFNNVKTLQRGTTIFNATAGTQSITAVDLSKALLFSSFSNVNNGGGVMWTPKAWLSSNNGVTFDPGFAPYGSMTHAWQVIEFN